MTLRQELTAALQAAGLRLSPVDIDALMPAWRRYRTLVDAFLDAQAMDQPTG